MLYVPEIITPTITTGFVVSCIIGIICGYCFTASKNNKRLDNIEKRLNEYDNELNTKNKN